MKELRGRPWLRAGLLLVAGCSLSAILMVSCRTVDPDKVENEEPEVKEMKTASSGTDGTEGGGSETDAWDEEAEMDLDKKQEEDGAGSNSGGELAVHTVKEGENLWGISNQYYGSGIYYPAIREANNLDNAEQIRAGQDLTIPQLSASRKETLRKKASDRTTSASSGGSTASKGSTYMTREGDTFWKIAKRVYGNGAKWVAIWKANKDRVPDPDKLMAGVELQIPGSPDEGNLQNEAKGESEAGIEKGTGSSTSPEKGE